MTLFRDRDEWSDVTPVPQDDGPNPACPIAYSEDYRDAMDYFRAVYRAGEISERALQLTTEVIELNAANYTAWQYRRRLIKGLEIDLFSELEYVSELIDENIKNYQVWYHRRAVVEMLGDSSHELDFTEKILEEDAKNYHSWQHRHWAMEKFDLFKAPDDGGLDYVDRLLDEDVRNNSAWNHRYFVIEHTVGFTAEVCAAEVAFVLCTVKKVVENESAWNYLKGVCARIGNDGLLKFPEIKETCLMSLEHSRCHVHALATLLEIYALEAVADPAAAESGRKLCDLLAEKDNVRAAYWGWRKAQFSSA